MHYSTALWYTVLTPQAGVEGSRVEWGGKKRKRKRRKKLGRSVEDEEEQSAGSTMDDFQKPQAVLFL